MSHQPPALFVMRSGALGDFILTLPALRALRRKYPEHRLVLATRADVLPLAQGLIADDVIAFDSVLLTPLFVTECPLKGMRALTDTLQNMLGEVDLAVLWLPDATARIVANNLRRMSVARLIAANPSPMQRHASDHLLDTLAPIGIAAPLSRAKHVPSLSASSSLPLAPHIQTLADEFWHTHSLAEMRVIALHVGSGGKHKCWPSENFLELARRLSSCEHTHVVLISGPAEANFQSPSAQIQSTRFTLLASPPLTQLAAILARCALYVGNDSGVTHLSAALGTPTVALFGPTDPQLWGPRGMHITIIQSPTTRMEDLSVEQVWQKLCT